MRTKYPKTKNIGITSGSKHPTRSRLRFFGTHIFVLSSNFTRGVSETLALEPRFHHRSMMEIRLLRELMWHYPSIKD